MLFRLACLYCDCGMSPSPEEALEEGWRGLERDDSPEPAPWTHLGVCPDCQAARPAEFSDLRPVITV